MWSQPCLAPLAPQVCVAAAGKADPTQQRKEHENSNIPGYSSLAGSKISQSLCSFSPAHQFWFLREVWRNQCRAGAALSSFTLGEFCIWRTSNVDLGCAGGAQSSIRAGIKPQLWFCWLTVLQEQPPCCSVYLLDFWLTDWCGARMEREQETSCTSCLPLSVPINLICVQQEPFPLVHTVQPCHHSSFYINQSLVNFSLHWI